MSEGKVRYGSNASLW